MSALHFNLYLSLIDVMCVYFVNEVGEDMTGSNSAAEVELQQHHSININTTPPHPPHPVSPSPGSSQHQRPGPNLPSAVYLSG